MSIDLTKFKTKDVSMVKDIELLLSKNPIILDIRSKKEFDRGHLNNAINIVAPLPPISDFDLQKLVFQLGLLKINKNRLILVYCKLGKRAGLAKSILRKLNYKNVISLGGIDEYPLKYFV